MDLLNSYISDWAIVRRRTIRFIGQVPHRLLRFSPLTGAATIHEQVEQLADAQAATIRALRTGVMNLHQTRVPASVVPTPGKLVQNLRDLDRALLSELEGMSQRELQRPIGWEGSDGITAYQLLLLMKEHEAFRQGCLDTSARLGGMQSPRLNPFMSLE